MIGDYTIPFKYCLMIIDDWGSKTTPVVIGDEIIIQERGIPISQPQCNGLAKGEVTLLAENHVFFFFYHSFLL